MTCNTFLTVKNNWNHMSTTCTHRAQYINAYGSTIVNTCTCTGYMQILKLSGLHVCTKQVSGVKDYIMSPGLLCP